MTPTSVASSSSRPAAETAVVSLQIGADEQAYCALYLRAVHAERGAGGYYATVDVSGTIDLPDAVLRMLGRSRFPTRYVVVREGSLIAIAAADVRKRKASQSSLLPVVGAWPAGVVRPGRYRLALLDIDRQVTMLAPRLATLAASAASPRVLLFDFTFDCSQGGANGTAR